MLITGQFINNGLQCMSEMLRNALLQPADLTDCIERAGQLLRVLAHVIESMREQAALLPQLDPMVQDEFIDAICVKFNAIESILTSDGWGLETSQVSRSLIFLARLLQFNLGFRGAWTAKAKSVSDQLVSALFRLALVSTTLAYLAVVTDSFIIQIHGSGEYVDLVTFSLIVDTLYYVIDGTSLLTSGDFLLVIQWIICRDSHGFKVSDI